MIYIIIFLVLLGFFLCNDENDYEKRLSKSKIETSQFLTKSRTLHF
ncbi:hypothetical protein NNC19_05730 [Clostridium sp. SHJSY1]|nr:hypothetical protein [Clostridium sp. SHJSY1]MDS0525175.1 hypothetical protein [Clostridium sp. SHJSY1]